MYSGAASLYTNRRTDEQNSLIMYNNKAILRTVIQGVSEPSHDPPPDPAAQVEQDWDQQNDHDEAGTQEEKVEDPSSGGQERLQVML